MVTMLLLPEHIFSSPSLQPSDGYEITIEKEQVWRSGPVLLFTTFATRVHNFLFIKPASMAPLSKRSYGDFAPLEKIWLTFRISILSSARPTKTLVKGERHRRGTSNVNMGRTFYCEYLHQVKQFRLLFPLLFSSEQSQHLV